MREFSSAMLAPEVFLSCGFLLFFKKSCLPNLGL